MNTEIDTVSERYYIQESVDMEMGERLSRVEGILHTLIQFCQRNSVSVDERERQVCVGIGGREGIIFSVNAGNVVPHLW